MDAAASDETPSPITPIQGSPSLSEESSMISPDPSVEKSPPSALPQKNKVSQKLLELQRQKQIDDEEREERFRVNRELHESWRAREKVYAMISRRKRLKEEEEELIREKQKEKARKIKLQEACVKMNARIQVIYVSIIIR
jgi:hypothetical protein